jgi:DNA-binding NarL/FixJ family response regulator
MNEAARCRRPRAPDCSLVERVLTGEAGKAIAADLRISLSTLSARCSMALAALGCSRLVSRLSPVVAMAALAASGEAFGHAKLESRFMDSSLICLASVVSPAQSLRDRLSNSEYEVARAMIEGESHVAIARARGTSQRTVANQLASIFRKLNVSGRSALRAFAIRESARPPLTNRKPLVAC